MNNGRQMDKRIPNMCISAESRLADPRNTLLKVLILIYEKCYIIIDHVI